MTIAEPNPEDPNKQSQDVPVQLKDVIKSVENENEIYIKGNNSVYLLLMLEDNLNDDKNKVNKIKSIIALCIYATI